MKHRQVLGCWAVSHHSTATNRVSELVVINGYMVGAALNSGDATVQRSKLSRHPINICCFQKVGMVLSLLAQMHTSALHLPTIYAAMALKLVLGGT